jgi:hypothetical protein
VASLVGIGVVLGLGASVGSGVGLRVGFSVNGALVAARKVDCGPNLAKHPHEGAFTPT